MTELTADQLSAIDKAIDTVLPEATEYVASLKGRIQTTQDSYGRVMSILSGLADVGPVFLLSMVRAGYPASTGEQLARIMGYRPVISDLILREGS